MRTFVSFMIMMACFGGTVFAQGNITDRATGVSFPDTVTIDQNGQTITLHATGVSTRKKFIAKVYSVASYMENPTRDFNQILQDNQVKQLSMVWVRSVDAKKVKDGYEESLRAAAGGQYNSLKGVIDQFIGYFNQNVSDKDQHALRWFPSGNVEVWIKGSKVGTIENADFGKVLWSVWFGPNSVVKRNELVDSVR